MALQVWLPLNGSGNNQGIYNLSNLTFTNGTWDNNGKIGKCINLASGYSNTFSISSMSNVKQMSICFWFKMNTATSSDWLDVIHFTSSNGTTTAVSRYELYTNCSNSGWFDDAAGSSIAGCGITANTWTHIAITWDAINGKIKMYKNGSLFMEQILSTSWYCTGNNFRLGESGLAISENDIRIYDNCLSPREVHEIAKGLVLHYKLDGINDGIHPNLIKNSMTTAPSGYNDYTGKATAARSDKDDKTVTKIYAVTFPSDSDTYSNYNLYTYFTRDTDVAVQKDGKTYTLSFKVKASKALSNYQFYYEYTNTSVYIDVTTNWKTVSITGTANGTYSAFYICMGQTNRNKINGGTIYLADLKLEEGSIATSWCPHTSDTEYTSLGYNIINTKLYDCSGFGNNLTLSGSVLTDFTSPRYDASVDFNQTGYFYNTNFNLTTTAFTFSMWIKKPSTITGQHFDWGTFDSWTGNGIGNYWDSGSQSSSGGVMKATDESSYGGTGYTIDLDTWTHVAIVWDGTTILRYKNGAITASGTYGSSSTCVHPRIYLGNSAFGTASSETSENSMSDFRMYTTALSADDIKELYNVSATVDNSGNMYAYEFVEE